MGAVNELRIYSDEYIPGLKRLADAVHAEGAKIFMQLHHGGKWADSRVAGHPNVSSSSIVWHVRDEIVQELTTQEVYELIERFGDAAVRAKKAGYDGVELHGAHGYLIPQFMSAYVNKRFDEFGGDILGRSRFATGVIENIKQKCGADFAVVMRLSGDEMAYGGMKINETRVMAKLLEKAGADALHISIGMPAAYGDVGYSLASYRVPMGFNAYTAEEIKKSVKLPIITVGRIIDPAMADAIIEDGMADFVALGRASLADAEFPKKVLEGRIDEILPCIGCMARCCTGPGPDGVTPGSSCALNPFSGHEADMKIEPARESKTIVIVGAGVGGLEAAWVAAARGHKVILFEKEEKPGGQARAASMPPNKQRIALAIKHYLTMCRKYGVDIRLNAEADADMIVALDPDVVILGTGATPSGLQVPNDGIALAQATKVLNGEIVPGKKVLVAGGGLVGLETAEFLLTLMRSVTVVEMLDEAGADLLMKDAVLNTLRDGGVDIMTSTKIERFTKDGAVCSAPEGEITLSGYDMVVLAVGSQPYNPLEKELEGKVPEIQVIGDAKEVRRIQDAVQEGAELAVGV
jgi:2,4-dienoyl-CoA reductase-like NADH-dependent reductase (Old Yellow Enzyme family)/thioredoxin reductase